MNYRNTASFGKRTEYKIIGEMLKDGLDVYVPLVDDHGVDCVIKKQDGQFVEIQIKGRSRDSVKEKGSFSVDDHFESTSNLYFIFYSELLELKWIFSSQEFIEETKQIVRGKNAGKRKIILFNDNGEIKSQYEKYLAEGFGKITD